jgi:hypothetical protein
VDRRFAAVLVLVLAGCGGGSSAARHPKPLPPAPQAGAAYKASVAYARCLRRHGLDHPDPDPSGDFHLTPAQEDRLRASAPESTRQRADKDCFHFLKGTVSTKPLSKGAIRAALVPLRDLKRCLAGFGIVVGKPTVQNMPRGRAMFGFESAGETGGSAAERADRKRAQATCEKRVRLAQRLDEIIKIDRGETR